MDLCFRILTISPAGWIKTVAIDPSTNANCLTHTYSSAGCYDAKLFGCCRISSNVNNRVADTFLLKTTANTAGTNRSPYEETTTSSFGQLPELVVGQALTSGSAITFQMLSTDPDGNPIHWSMTSNLDATNTASANGPSSEPGQPAMSISSSGLVTWYNYGIDNIKPWTVQFYACDNNTSCTNKEICSPIDLLLIIQPTVQSTGACVATQGYWKNHTSAWPVSNLTIGGHTYTMSQILGIWGTSPAGDNTISLFHQLAAAMLNVANGSVNTCIQQTITDANAFLVAHPIGSNLKGSAWNNSGGPTLLSTLTDYNEGKLCATHRDSPNCGSDGREIQ
jgi:hypothetical protein